MVKTKVATVFAVIVALALAMAPAASADFVRWTKDGSPINENHLIEASTAELPFSWGSSGYYCDAGFWGEIYPGNEGEAAEIIIEGCRGEGGPYGNCNVDVVELDSTAPLRATPSGEIEVYDFDFVLELSDKSEGLKCQSGFAGKWHFVDATITLDPDNAEAISTADFTITAEKVHKPHLGTVFNYSTLPKEVDVYFWSEGVFGIEVGEE